MRINNALLAIFILCLFSINAYAESEKDALIHKMLTQVDLAIENKDADTVADHLDDNIHIVMNLTMSGQTQRLEFTKDEYMKTLKDGWAVTEEYTYTRDKVHIEYIGNGNKAVVTATVYELSVVAGRPMAALSQEKMLVEFRNDAPIVVNLTANTDVRM
jgi:hypothetical protein